MDFVVVGVGIGALAILLGLIVRDAGSWWVRRAASRAPTDPRRTRTLHGVCRAAGRALALDGLVLLAVTAVALFAGWSDRAGATAVMLALAIVLLGSIGWAFRYTQRHYSRPPRRSARMAGSPAITADPPPDVRIDAGDTHALSDHDVAARTESAGELAQAEASVAGADPPLTKESASGAETDRASDTSVD
ncbi:MAG: hypothetical protein IT337_17655, partial [Thermomicrobiales bacterium]|nr:hypothetical protein [Thermomicrobiales bacterium]